MRKHAVALIATLLLSGNAVAKQQPPWSLELYGLAGSDSDIERGSEVGQQQYGGAVSYVHSLGRGQLIGVSAGADWHGYDFSDLNGSNSELAALDQRERYELGLFYMMPISRTWSILVSPQVQWAYADGADASDGFGYSAVVLANYRASEALSFGFGVAYVNGVTSVKSVPFVSFDWQISPKWRLSNPFEAGFNGRAGIELSYQHNSDWEFGVGGGYRSDDFAYANGDIEQEQPLSFVRARYQWRPQLDLSLVAGYRWQGDLTLHSGAGEVDYEVDGHPLGAVLVNLSF